MNKRFRIAAMAIALAGASFGAMAQEQGAFFINGNAGQSDYHDNGFNNSNTEFSGAVRGGYTWQSPVVDFGVEVGYVDLGKASGSFSYDGLSENYTGRIDGPLLGINLKYKFQNNWFLAGRAGFFHSEMKFQGTATLTGYPNESFSQTYSGNGGYIGAIVGYDITPHFSLGASYDSYYARVKVSGQGSNETIGVVSGFAEYRF
jgi:hypothetical protein